MTTETYTPHSIMYCDCKSCGQQSRIEKFNPTVTAMQWFCPSCGAMVKPKADKDLDSWYTLAEACGIPPTQKGVKLVKEIYETWETSQYRRFTEYVDALREGVT